MSAEPLETRLRSATKEVVIGHGHRFCIIGERINPTGRRIFQEQLRAGDFSAIERDVKAQVEGGADVLDINMGVPLTDEPELLAKAIQLVQSHTDLPICIDSSVVEALEAGLSVYQGRALVNSITAEDDRMAAILPLVKKYDAAIIALPNDHDEIPMEADKRLELTAKIIRVATTEYGIAQADIVIDPLAMPIGADTGNSLVTMECMRRIRDEFGVNMTCGASNVSFGMPDRHTLGAAWLPMAMTCRPDQRDHGRPDAADRGLGQGGRRVPQPRRLGHGLDRRAPGEAGRFSMTSSPEDEQPFSLEEIRREGLITPSGAEPAAHDGTGRVQLSFTVEDKEAPPTHRQVRVPPGVSVFDSASWNGIAIDSTCGGHGTCHKCKVRVSPATPVTRHDARTFSPGELDTGWRLACLVQATRDHDVVVPPLVTRPKAATVGVGRQVILRPAVQKRYVELTEPTLEDQRSDLARLLDAIDDLEPTPDLHALRRLPKVLREADFKVTAVIVDEALVDVEPGDTTSTRYAIAFDLGTTTVVATLLDLVTGTPVGVASMLNRQQPFGADVISRISATMLDPAALGRLQVAASQTLATLAEQVCREGGVDPAHVYEAALAGNATMTALLLGIDPEPLGVAPFVQTTATPPTVLASEVGLELHPGARLALFPALGAYVGGDIVAGMLATGMDRDKRIRLFIDVGTNCEIVLSDGERILSTAAPAGPAFEGGAIRCGMRAADGAIEVVKLGDDVELGVIGDVEPRGLCGSGLVDAVAELVKAGLLDASGRFATDEVAKEIAPAIADRLTYIGQERVFVLHRERPDSDPAECVVLSQRDVRELQFAKAAISTGWTLLMEELGLEHRDLQQVLLAGSFGSYLSAASAVRIGLVPQLPVLRIVAAGNVAGEGAKMALLSIRERAGALALLEEVTYVELSDRTDFNDRFVDLLAFPT